MITVFPASQMPPTMVNPPGRKIISPAIVPARQTWIAPLADRCAWVGEPGQPAGHPVLDASFPKTQSRRWRQASRNERTDGFVTLSHERDTMGRTGK
jgi:hypothetical protein